MTDIVTALRSVSCDQEAFTANHRRCICRLTNLAADEIEKLRAVLDRAEAKANEIANDVRHLASERMGAHMVGTQIRSLIKDAGDWRMP